MDSTYRQTQPLMRFALILGSILTFLSGVQLFVLTNSTADLFAWTIAAGATATLIGAFYWTGTVIAFVSWRRQPWANARVGIPGVVIFLWATLISTVMHLDKFHFSSATTPRLAAWAWLIIYIVDPILLTTALVLQRRSPGQDPPRNTPLAAWYRYVLQISGVMFAALGLVMLIVPTKIIEVSAFQFTPLTCRIIGSWLLGMGVVFVTMAWENDVTRIRPAAIGLLVLPVLILVGMARYWEQFKWGPAGWVNILLIVVVVGIGIVGLGIGRDRTTETA